MSYLNPPYPNNFQELCASMPLFYLDVREMRAILRAQGRLLDCVCDGLEQVVDFNFILTADEATIRKWEKALKITYKENPTLDQRKHVVIGYIIGLGHIGEQEIRGIIGQYTSGHIDFDFMRGTITIAVEGEIPGEENLVETFFRIIPAHLTLKMSIHIRREFRHTIPVAQGGAIGSNFLFAPEALDSLSARNPLYIMQAAINKAGMTTGYPDVYCRDEIHLGVGHEAVVQVSMDGGDILPEVYQAAMLGLEVAQLGIAQADVGAGDLPDVRQSARAQVDVTQAAMSAPILDGTPPGAHMAAEMGFQIAQGAFSKSGLSPDSPNVKRASVGRTSGAGGLFYHTHTKSKLIE